MKVAIAGAGAVGRSVARELIDNQHDVTLIERKPDRPEEQPFTDLLKSLRNNLDQFIPMVQEVWSQMDSGGFSTAIRHLLIAALGSDSSRASKTVAAKSIT